MNWRARWRTAAVGGVSVGMLSAWWAEERLRGPSEALQQAYVRRWARRMLRLLGVELDVVFEQYENRDPLARPRLVVANHRSTVDILIMLHLFGGQLLARADMAGWPAIGL